jgi:Predicted amidophosphoribosyltransferases
MIIIINFILDLIYPPKCIVCDNIIEFGSKKFLCDECKDLFKTITGRRCEKCSRPIKHGKLCSICTKKNFYFDKNYSLFVYDELMQDLIHRFKFKNHPAIGKGLGKIMAHEINFDVIKNVDYILAVPIHKIRRRNRGFNQSEILAKEIARKMNLPMRADILKRIKNTKPQWHLNSHERENNLENAFSAKNVKGLNLMLIDDIFTTGSTINKCAQFLKDAGAKSVISFTLSITVKKNEPKNN